MGKPCLAVRLIHQRACLVALGTSLNDGGLLQASDTRAVARQSFVFGAAIT